MWRLVALVWSFLRCVMRDPDPARWRGWTGGLHAVASLFWELSGRGVGGVVGPRRLGMSSGGCGDVGR